MSKPVFPTVPNAYVFQKFGAINWQLYGKTEGKHMGIDIGVTSGVPGSPIYAVYPGLVIEAGYFEQGGYGRRVVIQHESGTFYTLYAHLKDVLVKEGDPATIGQQIGTMGGNVDDKFRGASGGTHLHFEVILSTPVKNSIRTFKGWCVDPFPYLMERYFTAPINAIKVTSVKGLRVRVQPSVNSDSVTALSLGDRVNVMEVLQDQGSEQWVKLWTLRDEYCAIKHNRQPNAVLMSPVIARPEPIPIPEPEGDEFQMGFQAAVARVETFLDELHGQQVRR